MSRFLLLILFVIWMAWRAEGSAAPLVRINLALFFGTFCLIIGMMGVWSRLLARRVGRVGFSRAHRYFNRVIFAVRFFVPIWFGIGVFVLGWGNAVTKLLGPVAQWPVQLPGTILGTLPALIAWAGLWWAQYPADRSLHEQQMLIRLEDGQPIYRQQPLWSYLMANLRLQILFTAVPIMLILAAHDVVVMVLSRVLHMNLEDSAVEGFITFGSAIGIFLIVPEILTHVLPTQPLPRSELRDRMEVMCHLHKLKFRNILLWRTENRIANALVMGIIPRFRYVLLSDLLLEEMNDAQIEAVFAHELGHVVHRHLIWLLVFMKALLLTMAIIAVEQTRLRLPSWFPVELMSWLLGIGAFVVAFGYVSRRFERQADVFAARTLQQLDGVAGAPAIALIENPGSTSVTPGFAPIDESDSDIAAPHLARDEDFESAIVIPDPAPISVTSAPVLRTYAPGKSHVGPYGAALFASALQKVADINNMPIEPESRWEGNFARRVGFVMERMGHTANSWLHGSIAQRMRTLQTMSADPTHTRRFDRRMSRLYATIIAVLVISAATAWLIKRPI